MLRFLFYRNRFRQVSRFIHIEASADRYVVAKELQRNDRQGVCKNRICLRQVNYVVGYFFSIREMVPCFSSPAAYASEWM